MNVEVVQYCSIAQAKDWNESIQIQMLLDRARLPYRIVGENSFSLYGNAALSISGPMNFMIPIELKAEAEEILNTLFEIDFSDLPSHCPACDTAIPRATVDCPSCGLFLG